MLEDDLDALALKHVGDQQVYDAVQRIKDLERRNAQLSEQFRLKQNLLDQITKEVLKPIRDLHTKLDLKLIDNDTYLAGIRYYTSPH